MISSHLNFALDPTEMSIGNGLPRLFKVKETELYKSLQSISEVRSMMSTVYDFASYTTLENIREHWHGQDLHLRPHRQTAIHRQTEDHTTTGSPATRDDE